MALDPRVYGETIQYRLNEFRDGLYIFLAGIYGEREERDCQTIPAVIHCQSIYSTWHVSYNQNDRISFDCLLIFQLNEHTGYMEICIKKAKPNIWWLAFQFEK